MKIELIADKKVEPVVKVTCGKNKYFVPLNSAVVICNMNEMLRYLNTGLEIHFESFSQYALLLMDVTEALEKRKPTA